MAVDVPVSIWRKTNGQNDNVYTGITYVVDTDDFYLVDPDDNYIIDTGIEMPKTPISVWIEDDSR